MVCFCKTECLREAVNGPEGIQVHEERVSAHTAPARSVFLKDGLKKSANRQKKGGGKT